MEKPPLPPTPEEPKELTPEETPAIIPLETPKRGAQRIERENEENASAWLKKIEKDELDLDHEKTELFGQDHLIDYEPLIQEFQTIASVFELEHSLEELFAITDLTVADAPNHPVREPARLAMVEITRLRNALKNENGLSEERYEPIERKYTQISRAVGMINNGKVDHTRTPRR